ncbi:SRPBCC domain-containing protein [Leptospira kirschneri]|uniref:SRPBCC domain-containing protein n=1 Tax=Leptospira kirschneri TaxID=29507 RepID=UPI000278616D|nr:SRPBCC domain-containing protein [Leptospira kirschneri]EJO69780.1 hypothetical protein LEP1GSC044_2873 [Leptospira kirschneri serovar Grippotyphosa str. RM52]EKQ82578.1 hypothetical protein LEP1GSC064_2000 [Leptospira kirschneri serovar Grippotyphosa str. Moskva]EKR07520.1 hypothetical protein LEP1GSC122_2631 [Leptospira kirschneri serovar Valbuzzi str. 200702274]EMK03515.1 hypothetical protein LEP1GSC176_3248 [Leptospira kirschneri str. MMD1493]EMK13390.1 hypothetical protein LEP1GSC042_3
METIRFSILIDADVKTVWHKMFEDSSYRIWSREFHEGSYYEGSWEKGSEIRFLGPHDGKLQGMYSIIRENVPYKFISIEHIGFISDGVIDTESEEVKKWTPAFENYTFQEESDRKTKLIIEMQTIEEHKTMFEEMWPKALKSLKDLCER